MELPGPPFLAASNYIPAREGRVRVGFAAYWSGQSRVFPVAGIRVGIGAGNLQFVVSRDSADGYTDRIISGDLC